MAAITRWTWCRWVKAGEAPRRVPNLPGHPRWKRSDVEQFLQGRRGLRAFGSHTKQAVSVLAHSRSVRDEAVEV